MISNYCSQSTRSCKEHLEYKYLGVNDSSISFPDILGLSYSYQVCGQAPPRGYSLAVFAPPA